MSGELGGWAGEVLRSVVAPALVGFVSAALIALLSQVLMLRRFRREMLEKYHFGFFDRQLEAYQEVWTRLAPVSYYRSAEGSVIVEHEGRPHLHVENCRRFHLEIRSFFYSKHGLFLSKAVRTELFDARDLLEELVRAAEPGAAPEGLVALTRKQRKEVEWRYHRVRVALRNDLGLRDLEAPRRAGAEKRRP